jgi:hypothetical protein
MIFFSNLLIIILIILTIIKTSNIYNTNSNIYNINNNVKLIVWPKFFYFFISSHKIYNFSLIVIIFSFEFINDKNNNNNNIIIIFPLHPVKKKREKKNKLLYCFLICLACRRTQS